MQLVVIGTIAGLIIFDDGAGGAFKLWEVGVVLLAWALRPPQGKPRIIS
jgi:hypothetical protein